MSSPYSPPTPALSPRYKERVMDPVACIGVCRTTLQQGFVKTLAYEFSVVQRLVGEDPFRRLGLAFLAHRLSVSDDLHHVGATFSTFLEREFGGTRCRYFADVAALQWAWRECLVAEEWQSLNPRVLRAVPPAAYATLRFRLHPAARLLRSDFPIVRIWEVNQAGCAGEDLVDLDAGADFVLVRRTAKGVDIRRLGPGDFQLLTTLAGGQSLEEALEASLAREPQFHLSAALRRCFELSVLTEMTYDQSRLKECSS
jgi:Putative DNA-binding domain